MAPITKFYQKIRNKQINHSIYTKCLSSNIFIFNSLSVSFPLKIKLLFYYIRISHIVNKNRIFNIKNLSHF